MTAEIDILAPDPERHGRQIDRLARCVFGAQSYYEAFDGATRRYLRSGSYRWADSRVAVAGGRVVAHAGVWRFRMRVGCARLSAAGVGMVMTAPRYRGRGFARRLMEAVTEALDAGGYHVSVLLGIQDFYSRFGYAPAWPYVRADLDVERMSDYPRMLWRRRGSATDLIAGRGAIGRLYRRDYADRAGSAERPVFDRNVRTWDVHELIDHRERVRGYLATEVDKSDLLVWEVGGFRAAEGREELLAQLRDLARRKRCTMVKLFLGLGHPLMALARRRGCRVVAEHIRDGGPMARLVDLPGALERLTPELNRRLAVSYLPAFSGVLTIRGLGQAGALRIAARRVRPCAAPGRSAHEIRGDANLVRLLLGSDDPAAVLDADRFRLTGQARQLAAALFPPRQPYLMRADWF